MTVGECGTEEGGGDGGEEREAEESDGLEERGGREVVVGEEGDGTVVEEARIEREEEGGQRRVNVIVGCRTRESLGNLIETARSQTTLRSSTSTTAALRSELTQATQFQQNQTQQHWSIFPDTSWDS